MTAEVVAQALLSGLLMGFVYALVAAGLSLIFGLMEIVNFAHGEFLMLAMFATFWAWALAGLDPVLALPLATALLFGVGWIVYRGVISRILAAPMLAQIFATFGLSVFLRSGAQFLWTPDFRLVQNPWIRGRLLALRALRRRPPARRRPGRPPGLRAPLLVHHPHRDGARPPGDGPGPPGRGPHGDQHRADVRARLGPRGRLRRGGRRLLANFFYVFPDVGAVFALLAYVTVALGGFGNVAATLLGGVLIGLVENLVGLWAPAFKYVGVFCFYLLVVLWRPQGLFGRY